MYVEGDVPSYVGTNGNCNNGGMFGNDGFWAGIIGLIAVAAIFSGGFGNGGGLFGNRSNGGSTEMLGYQLGGLATQADIASGFNNSAVLSSLNDLKLGQQTGFAAVQQTLCQGFGGINTALVQQGYETRLGVNSIATQLANCCCDLRAGQQDIKYALASDTCDIKQAINAQTQQILGYLCNEKISALQNENSLLTAQLSQNSQTQTLLNAINRTPSPAFVVPNPYTGSYGYGYNNACSCGCNG